MRVPGFYTLLIDIDIGGSLQQFSISFSRSRSPQVPVLSSQDSDGGLNYGIRRLMDDLGKSHNLFVQRRLTVMQSKE